MDPGPLIAVNVVLLYTLLGPIVLFGVYVFFDVLTKTAKRKAVLDKKTDHSLMSFENVVSYLNRN